MPDEAPESSAVREALVVVEAVDELITADDMHPADIVARARTIADAAKKLRPHYLVDVFDHLLRTHEVKRMDDEDPDDPDAEPSVVADALRQQVHGTG